MNKPARITPGDIASPDYDADGYGWSVVQAHLIRERRFDEVDWENVAEEIESVGKSERRAAESALRIVLLHLLKWEHQETFRSRSWADSIRGNLVQFDREMAKNPSLKHHIDEMLADAYLQARYGAARETGLALQLFPEEPPSWDKIRGPLPE